MRENDAPTEGWTLSRWHGLYDLGAFTRWRARRVLRAFPVSPGSSVLDVGCGTGALAVELARVCGPRGRVCAIDASAAMIDATRRKAERARATIDARTAAVERLPFDDDAFDAVFATLMLHHLPPATLREGIREILRVLRPGGRFCVADLPSNPLHGHRGWEQALDSAGFVGARSVGRMLGVIRLVEARKTA